METNNKPASIFKYKSLDTPSNRRHFFDLLDKNEIYAPCVQELNDSFEGNSIASTIFDDELSKSAIREDLQIPILGGALMLKRVLSFSEKKDSPILWALYSSQYNGCCIEFSTDRSFKSIEKITYSDNLKINVERKTELETSIFQALMIKSTEWEHENEWRIIQDEENFHFQDYDIKSISIGYRTPNWVKLRIYNKMVNKIPANKIFISKPGFQSNSVISKPIDINDVKSQIFYYKHRKDNRCH